MQKLVLLPSSQKKGSSTAPPVQQAAEGQKVNSKDSNRHARLQVLGIEDPKSKVIWKGAVLRFSIVVITSFDSFGASI